MILDIDFPPDARVENEARALHESGCEIHLFSLSYKPFSQAIEVFAHLTVHRFSASPLVYKLSAVAIEWPFYNWLVTPLLEQFLKRVQPDVIHVHDMVIATAALRASRSLNIPNILDLHENRPAIMQFYTHVNTLPGKWLIRLNQWVKKQAQLIAAYDRVVVVTEEARDHYAQSLGSPADHFIVVPNTAFVDTFQAPENIQSATDWFELLYIGDTGLRRGTLLAIQAVSLIKEMVPNVRLTLVGAGRDDQLLRAQIKKLKLEAHVTMEGWQAPEKLPAYIAFSDICLSPLQRNLHHDTTYANKIFQYMAIGKPLVVSDCPPQARVVHEYRCGKVHDAADASSLASAVVYLYQNPKERLSMCTRARQAALNSMNFHHTANALRTHYRELADG